MSRDYRRRVSALEQATRILNIDQAIEADLREMWPEVERIASELGYSPEAVAQEVRENARERARLGDEAWYRAYAERMGITVDQAKDPDFLRQEADRLKAEYDEWEADMRARQVTWRAGVKYVGGVPVDEVA